MLGDQDALTVLDHFVLGSVVSRIEPLGNKSGFSGAQLWHAAGAESSWCVRAWPTAGPTSAELQYIHSLMQLAGAAGRVFVPGVFRTRQGTTFLEYAGRLWEITSWMPGQADFH